MKYLSSNSSVRSVQVADAVLVNGAGGRRFDFKAFQALCAASITKDECLFVWMKSVAQNALKSFNYLNGYKKTFRMLLALLHHISYVANDRIVRLIYCITCIFRQNKIAKIGPEGSLMYGYYELLYCIFAKAGNKRIFDIPLMEKIIN